jgi:hypothetical protein
MLTVFHEVLSNENATPVANYLGGVLYTVMNFCGRDKVRRLGQCYPLPGPPSHAFTCSCSLAGV